MCCDHIVAAVARYSLRFGIVSRFRLRQFTKAAVPRRISEPHHQHQQTLEASSRSACSCRSSHSQPSRLSKQSRCRGCCLACDPAARCAWAPADTACRLSVAALRRQLGRRRYRRCQMARRPMRRHAASSCGAWQMALRHPGPPPAPKKVLSCKLDVVRKWQHAGLLCICPAFLGMHAHHRWLMTDVSSKVCHKVSALTFRVLGAQSPACARRAGGSGPTSSCSSSQRSRTAAL